MQRANDEPCSVKLRTTCWSLILRNSNIRLLIYVFLRLEKIKIINICVHIFPPKRSANRSRHVVSVNRGLNLMPKRTKSRVELKNRHLRNFERLFIYLVMFENQICSIE